MENVIDYTEQLETITELLQDLIVVNYQIREVIIALFIGIATLAIIAILYKFIKIFL